MPGSSRDLPSDSSVEFKLRYNHGYEAGDEGVPTEELRAVGSKKQWREERFPFWLKR